MKPSDRKIEEVLAPFAVAPSYKTLKAVFLGAAVAMGVGSWMLESESETSATAKERPVSAPAPKPEAETLDLDALRKLSMQLPQPTIPLGKFREFGGEPAMPAIGR